MMIKYGLFAALFFCSLGFASDDWYEALQPAVHVEDFSTHLDDQNVHFYYFSQVSHDGYGDVEPFYHLLLEHSDICNINDLLSKLSDKGVVSLLKNAKSLYSLGDKIRRVHPLRFIGYIFSQYDLRQKMRAISESSFKWNNFIDGFGERMEKEMNHGNFHQYLPGFYDSLKHLPFDKGVADQLIYSHNWNGLVRYFMSL